MARRTRCSYLAFFVQGKSILGLFCAYPAVFLQGKNSDLFRLFQGFVEALPAEWFVNVFLAEHHQFVAAAQTV